MRAIVINEAGGPDALTLAEVPAPSAGPGQIVVDVAAAGLNFIDTYQRGGLYPMQFPFTPGMEGAGTIASVGDGGGEWSVGDRVAWTSTIGSYAEQVVASAERLVAVPDGVELEQAAAAILQGLTAHYLALDTFPLVTGSTCLVHAGAGGVGLLLTQIAKQAGATVFTTVGTDEKAALSRAAGADHVINYVTEDFVEASQRIGGERPFDVIYDGVGRTTFAKGLGLLRPRGLLVAFGNASGPPEPIDVLDLMRNGSIYVTRPTLFDYVATPTELRARAGDVFSWVRSGALDVRIGARFDLADAGDAHRALEGRTTTGKVLIIP
jgi:NADPH2:quinone reductase